MPFVRDPTLWPVLIVVIGHAVAFLAPILLLALRDGRGSAATALALLVVMSGGVVRSELHRVGRPGALSVVLLVTWTLGGGIAILADRTGIF
jgi:hypothetical protein